MLPQKTKYAIKALTYLAKNFLEERPVSIAMIAKEEKIPRKFLELILLDLKKKGYVKSAMGSKGGYLLSRHPEEIILSHVIRSTGGPISLLSCVSVNFYKPCAECESEEHCALRKVMLDVREACLKILSKTSLFDLIQLEKKLKRKNKNSE
ncbi:MAG: Rrf2 family transcriptional regulator [Bacteroidia bacterium]|nr:Rrf2 family transcriptional regulator [Bacteroidia bacterium]